MGRWLAQNTFVAGEWGINTQARTDIDQRANAMKEIVNYLVQPQGGLLARPGTAYLAEVKNSADVGELLPFSFNVEQSYAIEAGNLYFRFYTEAGRLESPPGTPVEVATPYLAQHLSGVHFTQSADVLYLAHPLYPPHELRRDTATTFSLVPYGYEDGPFQDFHVDKLGAIPKFMQASAVTGNGITVTAIGHTPFTPLHVGSIWALGTLTGTPKIQGYVSMTAFNSTSSMTADVIRPLSGLSSLRWAPPLWSDETGWPATVEFYDSRLTWGGAGGAPQHLAHTKVGVFNNFALLDDGSVTADSAIIRELAARRVNAIRGYVPSDVLYAMTAAGIWRIDGNNESTITPAGYRAKRISGKGASTVQPTLAGDTAFFLQRAGRRLFGMQFDLANDKTLPTEMTAFNQEVTGSGVKRLSFEDGDIPLLWGVRTDGWLAALTYDLSQQVVAWSRQVTDGWIESITTIPRATNEQALTFLFIRRLINGVSKRYIEVFDSTMELDSAITTTFGSPVGMVSGLTHLEGKTVRVKVDGALQPDKVVAGGVITGLTPLGTTVTVGLGFTPHATFLKPSYETPGGGATLPRLQRTARVVLDVKSTYQLAVNDVPIETRKASDPISTPPPLFTGHLDIAGHPLGNEEVTVSQPLPFRSHIRAAYRYIELEDE